MGRGAVLAIMLLFGNLVQAQVSGVAGSKLNAISNFALPSGSLEFEPTFSSSKVGALWTDGGLEKLDEITVSSGLTWRMAYGLSDNTSIGVAMPSDFSSSNFGIQTALISKDVFSLGAMAGLTLPFGNRTFDRDDRTADDLTLFGTGLIGTWNFNEKASLDLNIQYQDYFNSIGAASPSSMFYYLDYGHYVNDGYILLIFAASYQTSKAGDLSSNVFSLYPSIAFEHSDRYVIVLNTQHDVFGKNASKTFGFGLTLTTSW